MQAAWEREYVDYVTGRLPLLKRAAYLLCGDSDRADDLVQSTITRLFVHWARASQAENLDGYVHRILVRRYLDEQRLRWSRVRMTSMLPERVEQFPTGVEDADVVQAALRTLPNGQRAVLVLRFLCDLSVDSTAAALHCSPGNVKAQTSRGLHALRALLGDMDTERARS
jgi:RNA polymerase sigma-70 factor (sigma-E family)